MNKIFSIFLMLLLFTACSTPVRKLYIRPPEGMLTESTNSQVTYEVKDASGRQVRTLTLPTQHSPEFLKISNDDTGDSNIPATSADNDFTKDAKGPSKTDPSERLSYVRGIEVVNGLYGKKQYSNALIELAPLIEQYPNQARLLVMKGTIYRKLNELAPALRAYKQAAAIDRSNPELSTIISQLELEVGGESDHE